MSTTDYLKTLDYDQLQACREKCDAMIRAIQAEEKKIAWAVTDGGINLGWFRTEDYLKAVECIAKVATKRWAECEQTKPNTRYWLNLSIRGERLPESEYNALFSDGQWG
ncbi:hypothetical protein [Serratia liquefaciens]|uniref:hypothetical protein n=1 Tax=Serratia liquefaciens TaxID=614 RepID=UPI002183962E|nr:hypothetical protein [Serratia liquefaciens]CAI2521770.1 Uncharacterised protein [Serratia liquefaciens]